MNRITSGFGVLPPTKPVHDGTLAAVGRRPPLDVETLRAAAEALSGRRLRVTDLDLDGRRFLSEVVQSPNARPALSVYDALRGRDVSDVELRALVLGVARRRTLDDLGERGVLCETQARRAAVALAHLSAPHRQRLRTLLTAATRGAGFEPDPVSEQALVLKALAAQATAGAVDLDELGRFAKAIHGLPRYVLMKCTTLTDIDGRRNTERKHTQGLIDTRPHAPPTDDARADNDGLMQVYDSSCGPASVEVLRGEADPMFAFAVHAWGGPQAVTKPGLADRVERAWLMHVGDTPRRRRGMHDYLRLKVACGDLVQSGALSSQERLAVLRYCRATDARLTDLVKSGLALLHRHGRFPSEHDIERMRAALPATPSVGTDDVQMTRIVAADVGPVTGVRYHYRTLPKGNWRPVDLDIAVRAGESGLGAVLGTSDHWWALVGARTRESGREFLVHDPWTAITAWVSEAAFADGTFQRTHFGWPSRAVWDGVIVPDSALHRG